MTRGLLSRLGEVQESLRGRHRRVPRGITRTIRAGRHRAMVQMARLEDRANVTREALAITARLSKDEETHIQAAPLSELRIKTIIDSYAGYAAWEIGRP
jgi:hypothetical protein